MTLIEKVISAIFLTLMTLLITVIVILIYAAITKIFWG